MVDRTQICRIEPRSVGYILVDESFLVESLLLYNLSCNFESPVVIQMKLFWLLIHFFWLSVFFPSHLLIYFFLYS